MSSAAKTNFQKTKLIHRGNNVDVYEGSHTNFGRQVVIKELKGEANESVSAEFFKEAENWAKFENHRLARIDEINRDRGWIVQEYLPQKFTDRFFGNADLSEMKASMLQILEGLEYLHNQGFLHCNLSDSNIRFDEHGNNAKLCDGRSVAISQVSYLPRPKGSNKFRAPEMLDNRFGPIGMATDLYLAATVILEGLAGDRFESFFQEYVVGTPDPETGWFRWHNSDEQLEPIKSLIPGVPEAFAKLLDDMLSKSVGRRVGSARDAYEELQRIDMSAPATADQVVPTDISQAKPRPPAPPTPTNVAPQSGEPQLISRPSTPAYMRIASGTLAGKIIPLNMEDIVIGEADHCHVNLSQTDYPKIAGREVSITLGSGGWKISETKTPEDCIETLIVGSEVCKTSLPIKSGDIVRLSNVGPDIQFVIQGESNWAWQDVADELNMKFFAAAEQSKSATPQAPQRPSAAPPKSEPQSEQRTAPLGQTPARAPAPVPSQATAPKAAAPPKPIAAQQKKQKTKKQKAPNPATPAPATPAAAAPASAAPAAPPAPSSSAAPSAPQTDKKGKIKPKSTAATSGNWLQDKNKRNWLILIGGLFLAAILIIAFMPRSGGSKKEKDKTEQTNDKTKSENNVDGEDK
jgi:serine/threonine protein kinase